MPPMDMSQPPMGDDMMGADPMGDQDPNMMGGDPNAMGDDEQEGMDDPKKELQKMTGELTQKMREYNSEQPQPDTDLNKYILGMVIKQASKDMTDDEKKEIINKLKGGFNDEEPGEDFGDDATMNNGDGQDMEMPTEQVVFTKGQIHEMLGDDIMNDEEPEGNNKLPKGKNKNNPFCANRE